MTQSPHKGQSQSSQSGNNSLQLWTSHGHFRVRLLHSFTFSIDIFYQRQRVIYVDIITRNWRRFFFISTICKTFILEIMFDQLWCIRIINDNHGRCSRAVIIIVLLTKKKWSSKTRPEFRLTIILMSVILKVLEVAEIIMFILQSVVHGFF